MNHTDDHNDRRRHGWLAAPLLLMVALCAQAQTNAPTHARSKVQKTLQKSVLLAAQDNAPAHARTQARTAPKGALLLALNDAPARAQIDARKTAPKHLLRLAQTVNPPKSQAKKPVLTEVVITGSRIARAANDTLQPTVVVSSARASSTSSRSARSAP
jgi:hypothetical protein